MITPTTLPTPTTSLNHRIGSRSTSTMMIAIGVADGLLSRKLTDRPTAPSVYRIATTLPTSVSTAPQPGFAMRMLGGICHMGRMHPSDQTQAHSESGYQSVYRKKSIFEKREGHVDQEWCVALKLGKLQE
jgi:hypothetical protein